MTSTGFLPKRPTIERTIAANSYVAHSGMRRWLNDELGFARIDALAALILRAIRRRKGAAAVSVFADLFSLPRSTVTSAIVRLEKQGLVRRYRSPTDGRVSVAEFTPAGWIRSEAVAEAIDAIEAQAEQAAGDELLVGFNRVASYLAAVEDEIRPGGW